MNIIPLTSLALMNYLEQSQTPEVNLNGSSPHSYAGKSVIEHSVEAGKTQIVKEHTQSELNQNLSDIMDSSWQSHCQFYADCSDCQRFQAKPNIDKALQAVVIINSSESCKRIKPNKDHTLQNIGRAPDRK